MTPRMHASVCRYKLTKQSAWANGIAVRVETSDTRDSGDLNAEQTITIIGECGGVHYPQDLYFFDELPRYGAFTYDPESRVSE